MASGVSRVRGFEPRDRNMDETPQPAPARRTKRPYTVSERSRAASLRNLERTRAAAQEKRTRMTEERYASCLNNLERAKKKGRKLRTGEQCRSLRETLEAAGERAEEYDRHLEGFAQVFGIASGAELDGPPPRSPRVDPPTVTAVCDRRPVEEENPALPSCVRAGSERRYSPGPGSADSPDSGESAARPPEQTAECEEQNSASPNTADPSQPAQAADRTPASALPEPPTAPTTCPSSGEPTAQTTCPEYSESNPPPRAKFAGTIARATWRRLRVLRGASRRGLWRVTALLTHYTRVSYGADHLRSLLLSLAYALGPSFRVDARMRRLDGRIEMLLRSYLRVYEGMDLPLVSRRKRREPEFTGDWEARNENPCGPGEGEKPRHGWRRWGTPAEKWEGQELEDEVEVPESEEAFVRLMEAACGPRPEGFGSWVGAEGFQVLVQQGGAEGDAAYAAWVKELGQAVWARLQWVEEEGAKERRQVAQVLAAARLGEEAGTGEGVLGLAFALQLALFREEAVEVGAFPFTRRVDDLV